MGRFDVTKLRYKTPEEWRILIGCEMGMKNHELVPMAMVASLANLKRGGAHKVIKDLSAARLLCWEKAKRGKIFGYRLTWQGYDFLALRALTSRGCVASVGNQIGVGKESDIYLALGRDLQELERLKDVKRIENDEENFEFRLTEEDLSEDNCEEIALKIHRLGRTCFRAVKNKRDYPGNRKHTSWIYLSRLSATREYSFQKCLYDRGFPVPKPLGLSRHIVAMELVRGYSLCKVESFNGHEILMFNTLMDIVVRLAQHGIVHGDLNEFNIMVEDVDREGTVLEIPKLKIIDFPQMISVEHPEAKEQFYRDVNGIRRFFEEKFSLELVDGLPDFDEILKEQREQEAMALKQQADLENTDVIDFKMNLMTEARKVGNAVQGGWGDLPTMKREDESDTDSDSDSTVEESCESEPEPEVKEPKVENQATESVSGVSQEFSEKMKSIRSGLTEITGTTSVAPEVIKLRVKKAIELNAYRQKTSTLKKADRMNGKNRKVVKNDIRSTVKGGRDDLW